MLDLEPIHDAGFQLFVSDFSGLSIFQIISDKQRILQMPFLPFLGCTKAKSFSGHFQPKETSYNRRVPQSKEQLPFSKHLCPNHNFWFFFTFSFSSQTISQFTTSLTCPEFCQNVHSSSRKNIYAFQTHVGTLATWRSCDLNQKLVQRDLHL